jgi:mRNA interferase RelE/StbE
MTYKIKFHTEAQKELNELDGSVKLIVLKQIRKLMTKPFLGVSLGNKAGSDLTGYRKLYANKKQIRIVYRIDEGKIEIYIITINKRENLDVYNIANSRKNDESQ